MDWIVHGFDWIGSRFSGNVIDRIKLSWRDHCDRIFLITGGRYYDKTLHYSLRPRDEHATHNLYKSVVRARLPKYVKYKACLFYYRNFFYIFPGLAY